MKGFYFSVIIAFAVVFSSFGQHFQRATTDQLKDKVVNIIPTNGDELNNKTDPFLRMVVNKITSLKERGQYLTEAVEYLNQNIRINENILSETSAPVFIKSNDVSSTASRIISVGGIVYTIIEDIITAEIPVSNTREIALSSEVIYIQGSYINEPLLDASRVETKVKQLHDGTGISRPYKGKDVIVGVVDSGIDWKHQDFKNAGGNRILYLWDMSGQSNPPSGYNYGTEYTKTQLDANQCNEIDGNDGGGHGTHVSGTAAGNGTANSQYIGMAPESDIVFVKGFRTSPSFSDVDVVNGCNYIFEKAGQLQKPAVINLSLGGQFGSHDGTSLYEQTLSNLTGNGKIIVAAAGNEGGDNIHLSYSTTGSSYSDSYETILLVPDNASASYIDMWYNSGNISVGIAAYDINTQELIGWSNPVAPGQQVQDQAFLVDEITYGWFTIDATNTNDPNNNSKEVFVAIDSHNGQVNLANVFWALYTFGNGTFDAWNIGGGRFDTYTNEWTKPGDPFKTTGIPGTSNKLICVGSYVTKTSWIDINGATQNQPGNPVTGAISYFSSLGPTRDNRVKPDIVAPGEVIIAALSTDYTQVVQSSVLLGGKLQKMQGTSMAAPHITGVIALMLEKNSSLNYDQVVDILKNTAVKDNFTGSSANNTYGHGKLDAYNAFLNVSGGGGGGQVTILQEGFDNTFLPAGWQNIVQNQNNTWYQGNVQNQNFNVIDPASTNSAVCPWVAENQDEWLVTSPFSLGNGDANVEFYIGYSTQWLSSATIHLKITTDNGSAWTNLWSAEDDGQGWIWRQKNISLNAYSNKTNLKLAWQYVGNDGDIVALDGVKLVGFQTTSVEELNSGFIPGDFALHQNYPNPFNPATTIRFELPQYSVVTIKLFDILGEEVATLLNEEKATGIYELLFDASHLGSGVYFYQIQAGSFNQARKMILLK